MAERYTRLFSLPVNQYTVGSPIVIAAGALLKDNQTGKTLAQIKFKSISEKRICALKISISAVDVSGKELEGVSEYQHLDLSVVRDDEFGQQQAVTLPDAVTRSIHVKCTNVYFADGSVWTAAPDAQWSPIPTQVTIEAQFDTLAEQYKRCTSDKSRFIPQEYNDLWLCSCGALNYKDESVCHSCCRNKVTLFDVLNVDILSQKDAEYRAAEEEKTAIQHKKTKKFVSIAVASIAVVVSAFLLTTKVIIPNVKYNNAIQLMEAGQYEEAIAGFQAMEDYKDSTNKIEECETAILDSKYSDAIALMDAGKFTEAISAFEALDHHKDSAAKISECNTAILDTKYNDAIALANSGKYWEAVTAFNAIGHHRDSKLQVNKIWDKIAVRNTISTSGDHTVGLKTDGSLVAVGRRAEEQCDVSNWKDIIAIDASSHTVGLKANGTVVAVGDNDNGKCNVSNWTNIVAIAAGAYHTVGLKSDGTVVAVGSNDDRQCNVSNWTDIVAISAGSEHTVGLKADGTVVAVGDNDHGKCNVSNWTDIVAISAGISSTVGLKSDGTVVSAGDSSYQQWEMYDWTNIVAIADGWCHTVGLKADGTVVAVGDNGNGQCNVSNWTDIVAIYARYDNTIGLKSDGTVVVVGSNDDRQCNVSGWRNIKLPN